jgi:hypothetical protein
MADQPEGRKGLATARSQRVVGYAVTAYLCKPDFTAFFTAYHKSPMRGVGRAVHETPNRLKLRAAYGVSDCEVIAGDDESESQAVQSWKLLR